MPRSTGPCSSCYNSCFNRAREQVRNRRQTSQINADTGDGEEENNQPWDGPSGPYLQQVMPAWQARLTWCQISIWLFLLTLLNGGLICASYFSWAARTEISLDYTDCANSTGQICQLELEVESDLRRHVYLYYGMRSAYFNHRRIQTGWSMQQLLGLPSKDSLTKACKEHAYRSGQVVLPCGALPNAIFNDTILFVGPLSDISKGNWTLSGNNESSIPVSESALPLSADGISWPSFISGLYRPLNQEKIAGTVPPLSWPVPVDRRYKQPFSDAEDLHMWLRTPAFSDFRKTSHRLPDGLPAGQYRVVIGYNYPVLGFGGKKQLIIGDKALMGGKNYVLLWLFVATTGSYLLLTVSTLIRGLVSGQCRLRKSIEV